VVARECGFSSWPALRRQLELLADYRRDPAVLPAALAERPGLVAEAVGAGADPGLAVRLGFDVSGRHEGQTALHTAAWNGDLDLVGRLVSLGADLDARDDRYDGRPVDWAGHARHSDVVSFLAEAAEAAERSADAGRAETAEAAAAARVRGGPGRGSRPAGTAP